VIPTEHKKWVFRGLAALCMAISFLLAIRQPYKYHEVDSYTLPVISIQYRGSLECCQEDILQAQKDFPFLYAGVDSYEQLRGLKLVKITENQWLPYYFPLYGLLCLPIKLLLQLFSLNQELCFTLTNAAVFSLAIAFLCKYAEKTRDPLLFLLIVASPVWVYLSYIGAETALFSVLIIALIQWRERRYKSVALLISIISMLNPTIMGVGILLFIDYALNLVPAIKKEGLARKTVKDTVLLMVCYIPSLLPFVYTYAKIQKWSLTSFGASMSTWDSLSDRILAYFFDLNLGIAAISLIISILFVYGMIYSVIKKDRHMTTEFLAALLTVICFSLNVHINCGMLFCARYVFWIYPAVVFPVSMLMSVHFSRRLKAVLGTLSIAYSLLMIGTNYNGSYIYFNNISRGILNTVPQFYFSSCKSTFASRTEHYDAALEAVDFVIYSDPDKQEIRKILYKNTESNKEFLLEITGAYGNDSAETIPFRSGNDGKYYYVSIPAANKVQFYETYNSGYINWITDNLNTIYGKNPEPENILSAAQKVKTFDEEICCTLFEKLFAGIPDNSEFIHSLYKTILGRYENSSENSHWCEQLRNGYTRKEIFMMFLQSEEFRNKYNI